jgi:hypothetical protein
MAAANDNGGGKNDPAPVMKYNNFQTTLNDE